MSATVTAAVAPSHHAVHRVSLRNAAEVEVQGHFLLRAAAVAVQGQGFKRVDRREQARGANRLRIGNVSTAPNPHASTNAPMHGLNAPALRRWTVCHGPWRSSAPRPGAARCTASSSWRTWPSLPRATTGAISTSAARALRTPWMHAAVRRSSTPSHRSRARRHLHAGRRLGHGLAGRRARRRPDPGAAHEDGCAVPLARCRRAHDAEARAGWHRRRFVTSSAARVARELLAPVFEQRQPAGRGSSLAQGIPPISATSACAP